MMLLKVVVLFSCIFTIQSFSLKDVWKVFQDYFPPNSVEDHPNFHLLPVNNCGPSPKMNKRIIGGEKALPGEFPWMAVLFYKFGTKKEFLCGGSLISEKYVLTAAHCAKSNLVEIRLGEYDLSKKEDCYNGKCQPPVQNIPIETVIPHESYVNKDVLKLNDIALIRLARPVDIQNTNVKPICLPTKNLRQEEIKKVSVVSGWGRTESSLDSDVLKKSSVHVMSEKDCRAASISLHVIAGIVDFGVPFSYICTKYMNGEACSGDSGGPLQSISYKDNSTNYVLEGVVSFGSTSCSTDQQPTVFTNVKRYMKWILDNMKE